MQKDKILSRAIDTPPLPQGKELIVTVNEKFDFQETLKKEGWEKPSSIYPLQKTINKTRYLVFDSETDKITIKRVDVRWGDNYYKSIYQGKPPTSEKDWDFLKELLGMKE